MASESEWLNMVRSIGVRLGWRTWHFHDSRRQVGGPGARQFVGDSAAAGYPDITAVHSRFGFVFAELKTDKGSLTRLQRESLGFLADGMAAVALGSNPGTGRVLVHVWRPADLSTIVIPALKGKPVPLVYGWER